MFLRRLSSWIWSTTFLIALISGAFVFSLKASDDESGEAKLPSFEDVTRDVGLEGIGGGKFSWGDFNNDGYPDLLIEGIGLYENIPADNSSRKFKNVTIEVKLDPDRCFGVWGDYDNDGFADIVSCSGALWKNSAGKAFEDVSEKVGLKISPKASSISWGDFDCDGFLDIYVATGEDWKEAGPIFYAHQFWRNRGDGTFEDLSEKLGLDRKPAYGRSVVWCDYDRDGRPEIYAGNYRLLPNFLWNQKDDGTIEDIAEWAGVAGEKDDERYLDQPTGRKFGPSYGHTIGCAWADFNNDGLFDIWVSNLVHKYVGPWEYEGRKSYDIRGYICDDSKIYINQGPPDYKFRDVRDGSGIPRKPIGGRGVFIGDELWSNVTCADFDNDGYVDVYVSQIYNLDYAYGLVYRNKGDATFEEVSARLGTRLIDSYGGAWADFDRDGNMDLVVHGRPAVDQPAVVRLFRNKGLGRSWIELWLKGTKSNRYSIGAVVTIRCGDRIQVRQVEGSTGSHSQQNSPIIHFGLGDIKFVDEIKIIWPSGKEMVIKQQKANMFVTITEP